MNSTIETSTYTAVAGDNIFADVSGGVFTITLPITGAIGDTIYINDIAGKFDITNITINRNGHNINAVANNLTCDLKNATYKFVYSNVTYGWIYTIARLGLVYDE